jgi:hypothetical protein
MSQGVIRLKKVKVAPKRHNSIIKSTVFKKKLSVRFEDQRPMETIKNLSQDIDLIGNVIDSYFPLKSYEGYAPVLSVSTDSSIFPQISSKEAPSHTAYKRSFDRVSYGSSNDMNSRNFRSSAHSTISENQEDSNSGVLNHKNIVTPSEAYGLDLKIVKKGRMFKPLTQTISSYQQVILTKQADIDMNSPKIVKQTRPLIKISKARRKPGKDINIAT